MAGYRHTLLIGTITLLLGVASLSISLAHENVVAPPHSCGLACIILGFAPLIGYALVGLVLVPLFSLIVCIAEEIIESDPASAPERCQEKFLRLLNLFPVQVSALDLFLKEHSPPPFASLRVQSLYIR